MTSNIDYSPRPIFSLADTGRETPPVGLIAPARYVQGPDLLDHLGRFLALVPSTRPAVYISAGGLRRHGERLLNGLRALQIEAEVEIFDGECSHSEIERAAASLQAQNTPFDCLIAVGGGKCLDAGKCVAAQPRNTRRHLPHNRLDRRALLCLVGHLHRRRHRPRRPVFSRQPGVRAG